MAEHTLFEDFKYKGVWWLPNQQDDLVSGELSYEPEQGSRLEIVGSWGKEIGPLGNATEQQEYIYGCSVDGKAITLHKTFATNKSYHYPGISSSIHYANYAFVGNHHIEADEEPVFASMDVNTTNLEEWLGLSNPFNVGYRTEDGQLKSYHAEYAPIEQLQGEIAEDKLNYKTHHGFSTDGNNVRTMTWKIMSSFEFTPDEPKSLSWYLRVLTDFTNFLTLLVGQLVYARKVDFKLISDQAEPPERPFSVSAYFEEYDRDIRSDVHPKDMLITLPVIRDDLTNALDLWFRKAGELKPLFDLFFGTIHTKMYSDFELLCYVHGIESYHGMAFQENRYMPQEEYYKGLYPALITAISSDVRADFRASLKSRMSYLNRYSLRKQLSEVISSLVPTFGAIVGPEPERFVEEVVATRNYVIHHDPRDKKNALDGMALSEANKILRAIITILLLREIKISDETIGEAISRHRLFDDLWNT